MAMVATSHSKKMDEKRAEIRATKSRSKKMDEKRAEIRRQVFSEIDESRVWNRKVAKGFTTTPRTMPLIGQIMDGLAGKGKPVFSTYLEIWSRTNDDGFATLDKHAAIAFASGFSGQRGVSTWKERVRKLEDLLFLKTGGGVSGNLHYVQLWNPYLVIKDHAEKKTPGFLRDHYNALVERMLEIGAVDLSA